MREYLTTKTLREVFREYLAGSGSTPAYDEETYRRRIGVHVETLQKYMGQWASNFKGTTGRAWRGPVTVRRIYDYFRRNRKAVLADFELYFHHKTHLSYEFAVPPRPLPVRRRLTKERYLAMLEKRTGKQANKGKVGEFVLLIMAEYVILHNYMWASGLRPPSVSSIDRFLRDM